METFLICIGVLFGLSLIYYGVRLALLKVDFTYDRVCGKKVFRLCSDYDDIGKAVKFFLIGVRLYKYRLRVGSWYRGGGLSFKWKVLSIEYTKWNKASILISTGGQNGHTVQLTQAEIDDVIETTAPVNSSEYDIVSSQYYGRVSHGSFQGYVMLDGTLVFGSSYEDAVRSYFNSKKPKKKYPQRRKHGVK